MKKRLFIGMGIVLCSLMATLLQAKMHNAEVDQKENITSKNLTQSKRAKQKNIEVLFAQVRLTPHKDNEKAILLLTLKNTGNTSAWLTDIEVLDEERKQPLAKEILFNRHIYEGNIPTTHRVSSVEIKPKKTVYLKPEHFVITLNGLNNPITKNGNCQLKLKFSDETIVEANAIIKVFTSKSRQSFYQKSKLAEQQEEEQAKQAKQAEQTKQAEQAEQQEEDKL